MGLVLLHEDADLLVVDKPAGLLTMASDRQKEKNAYFFMTDYVKKGSSKSRNRVFIVHRLDQDTSGVLVLAKHERAKRILQDDWEQARKHYLAVVHGHPVPRRDTISSYLAENVAHIVYSTHDKVQGKLSHTSYEVIRRNANFSLLLIDLLTGRKNQIRVHMSDIGHPIVGDRKYGDSKDPNSRMALHAWTLRFPHPSTGEILTFHARAPSHFARLVGTVSDLVPPD
jgi:RluA family pseudouridine synthase